MSGYFGIGVYHNKAEVNIGTLMRSAYQLGAAFVFTVGRRYRGEQSSDTHKTWRHIPLYHYADMQELLASAPYSCPIVGIEMGGQDLAAFEHPQRCIYLLGAEDHGLPGSVLEDCYAVVSLQAVRQPSYNVAVAGSIVMYDRMAKAVTVKEGESREL